MTLVLRNLAMAFIVNQGRSIVEAPKFLRVPEYRALFYPQLAITHPPCLDYWSAIDAMKPYSRDEVIGSSLNKLERFLVTPLLYYTFGQSKPTIDFRAAMDNRKIILVDLSDLGEGNGELIGAFIVFELLQAALSRAELSEDELKSYPRFHVFADEFQRFMTTAFPRILDEASKYGLDCVLAHQNRGGQLAGASKASTLSIQNKVVFRVNSEDAEELSWSFDTSPKQGEPVPQQVMERQYEDFVVETLVTPEIEAIHRAISIREEAFSILYPDLLVIENAYHLFEFAFYGDTFFGQKERRPGFSLTHQLLYPGPWSEERIIFDISRNLNPDHSIKEVDICMKEYRNSHQLGALRPSNEPREPRSAHHLPPSILSHAEYILSQGATGFLPSFGVSRDKIKFSFTTEVVKPIAQQWLDELRAILWPLKEKAIYWFDRIKFGEFSSSNDRNEADELQIGAHFWEVALFPEVMPWLRAKAKTFFYRGEVYDGYPQTWQYKSDHERQILKLQENIMKLQTIKRYKGYDLPVKEGREYIRVRQREVGSSTGEERETRYTLCAKMSETPNCRNLVS
jgi:hypothetical protein